MNINCLGMEIYNLKILINDILVELENDKKNKDLKNILEYYENILISKKNIIKNISPL